MAINYSSLIDALNQAILTGATSVSYEGKSVSYNSFDDMVKAVAYAERQLARANGQAVPIVSTGHFHNPYHRRRYGGWGGGWGGC